MGATHGRLIAPEMGEAAENMSLDQAMLESVDAGGPPTLRFYQWGRPTLSLGYFQSYQQRETHLESLQAVCVRRSSGGGAILHDHELTYSLAWPAELRGGGNASLYRHTHDAIAKAIGTLGVRAIPFAQTGRRAVADEAFLCFQRRTDDDLIVSGYKVLGSAQRRGKRALLQHGSLLLRASSRAPQVPGIFDLGAAVESVPVIADRIAAELSEQWGILWHPGPWTAQERQRSEQVACDRFDCETWLLRR